MLQICNTLQIAQSTQPDGLWKHPQTIWSAIHSPFFMLSETINDLIRNHQRPHQRSSTTSSETINDNVRDHQRPPGTHGISWVRRYVGTRIAMKVISHLRTPAPSMKKEKQHFYRNNCIFFRTHKGLYKKCCNFAANLYKNQHYDILD